MRKRSVIWLIADLVWLIGAIAAAFLRQHSFYSALKLPFFENQKLQTI
jgi:hypothetical protein